MAQTRTVTMIPARRRVGNTAREEERPKLRVAAYCRVSTDSDEQAVSYETQVEHYTSYIKKNPEWEFAGIFSDDGISGTYTKKREGFNKMIDECMDGKIDMIITKSISRFARNTLDCLKFIRQLKEKNIPVFFEKENINTMDAKGEVLLTIMASLAQQESQSLSQNVKLGLQYRYQNGQMSINHNRFLGFTKDEDGHLIVEPTEAEVVKRIYREYLEGTSLTRIDNVMNGKCTVKEIDGSKQLHLKCRHCGSSFVRPFNVSRLWDKMVYKCPVCEHKSTYTLNDENITFFENEIYKQYSMNYAFDKKMRIKSEYKKVVLVGNGHNLVLMLAEMEKNGVCVVGIADGDITKLLRYKNNIFTQPIISLSDIAKQKDVDAVILCCTVEYNQYVNSLRKSGYVGKIDSMVNMILQHDYFIEENVW